MAVSVSLKDLKFKVIELVPEDESQIQMIHEVLSQVFFPIFFVLFILSTTYETLYLYRFFMSGLTLPETKEINKKLENLKENLELPIVVEKKEIIDEVPEVIVNKTKTDIKN